MREPGKVTVDFGDRALWVVAGELNVRRSRVCAEAIRWAVWAELRRRWRLIVERRARPFEFATPPVGAAGWVRENPDLWRKKQQVERERYDADRAMLDRMERELRDLAARGGFDWDTVVGE